MNNIEINNSFSRNYSNEEICISVGSIARQLYADKIKNRPKTITRRFLVKELNEKYSDLNLADSLEINDLIRQSYEMGTDIDKEAIVATIKENIGNDSVYNPKRLYPSNSVSTFEKRNGLDLERNSEKLKLNSAAIDNEKAKNEIDIILKATQELKFKKGTLGIGNAENARKYGKNVLDGYESLISEYDKIRNINLDLVNDFEILRNELKYQREDVVQLLVDLFGDRAKQQYPELFDLSNIKWENFEDSWEKLSTHYTEINKNYQQFLEASDAAFNEFGNTISAETSDVFKGLKKTAKKRNLTQGDLVAGAAQVAVSAGISAVTGVIKSRNKSKEVVAIINRDVELLQKDMAEDRNRIVADIFRLGKIYSKLSDNLLPNFASFINKTNFQIETEFKPLYDSLMSNPIIFDAKNRNNELIERRRFLIQKNLDFKSNIQYSEIVEEELSQILNEKQYLYSVALSLMPKQPLIFWDIFTFGRASKIYNQSMEAWNKGCKPTIADYKFIQAERSCESEKREQISSEIDNCQLELENIKTSIAENSNIIKKEFEKSSDSEDQSRKLVKVVKDIINSSRSTIEITLDQELTQKTVI